MNHVFDSDTMWVIVLAGLAACMLSRRENGVVPLGNGPPVSREPVAAFSGEGSEMSGSFPLETLFGQQSQTRVSGDDIEGFLADVSGFVGNSGFVSAL